MTFYRNPKRVIRFFILLILSFVMVGVPAISAQEERKVQIFSGRIEQDELIHYIIPDLKAGDVLYASLTNRSGNLDPALLLTTADTDTKALIEDMRLAYQQEVAGGADPTEALVEIILENFLTGDDNLGVDSAAAIEFTIPEDGDYLLLALSTPINDTSGAYELIIGINAPTVLAGGISGTGHEVAFLDREASGIATAIQEVSGTLTRDTREQFFTMPVVGSGDTIYGYVEATSGDLIPLLRLEDYSGRVLRSANIIQQERSARFEFPVDQVLENYRIIVTASGEGEGMTTGDYRLLVGINEPEVLTSQVEPTGRQLLQGAIEVEILTKLQQITGVDQKAENYGGVYVLEMRWHDPSRAFSPDECRCRVKTFIGSGFSSLVSDENFRWPTFTIFNQQNNRWIQNQGIINASNGDMLYFERFTTTLQAPDFNFRSFPFDTQEFYLRVDSLFPENIFKFYGSKALSEVGEQLGEEEWQVIDYDTEVTSESGVAQTSSSRFSFGFTAHRHLNFYIMRIFVPTILIIIVSYFTFFLQNYSKRIDVTSANLLVFVAFNFTISDDLPRLGYLTFLDAMLAGVFVITALVVAFNVYLRRLELNGEEERAKKIDSFTLWVYPIAYLTGGAILTIVFLLPEQWESFLQALQSPLGSG